MMETASLVRLSELESQYFSALTGQLVDKYLSEHGQQECRYVIGQLALPNHIAW